MAAQLPARISFNGELQNLCSNPLEQYWTSLNIERPAFYPSKDCKRGYIASWEIRDNQLFLRRINGSFEKRSIFFGRKRCRYTLNDLLSNSNRKPIKALWVSGKLRIPQGKMTRYEPSGYDSRFEKEIILLVDKGDVLKIVTLDCEQKNLIVNSDIIVRSKIGNRV